MWQCEINKTLAEWAGVDPEIRCKAGINDPSRECSGELIEMEVMTPEAINRMIAEWAGCKHKGCRDCDEGTTDCLEGVSDSDCPYLDEGESWEQCSYAIARQIPDYFRTNAAMDLLGVLVDRGYKPELSYHNLNWWCKFSLPGYKQPEYYAMKPTIPAAICYAICELIEREGR